MFHTCFATARGKNSLFREPILASKTILPTGPIMSDDYDVSDIDLSKFEIPPPMFEGHFKTASNTLIPFVQEYVTPILPPSV